jgi:hypothetical protein
MNTVEKLEALKKVIIDRPLEQFDMSVFYVNRRNCGSIGCALGSLADSPIGREMRLDILFSFDSAMRVVFRNEDGTFTRNYEAGARALGISSEESEYLFNPINYADDENEDEWRNIRKEDVIERVDELIDIYLGRT